MNPFGPIFAIDLLTSARRVRYFVVRVAYATVLLFTLWTNHAAVSAFRTKMSIQDAALLAQAFFFSLTVMQLLAIVALGPALAAGTVALERERRTIEYLFASDLSNIEIVFGKMFARFLQLACLIGVGVPVFALAMLLGGIAPEQLLIMFLVTLSTMLMVVALSVNISVWTPRARDAVVRAYVILGGLLVLPLLIQGLLMIWKPAYPLLQWIEPVIGAISLVNPFLILSVLGFAAPGSPWRMLGMIVSAQLCLAAISSVSAVFALRRTHLKAAGKSAKRSGWMRRWWRPEMGQRPMIWKECFAEHAGMRLGIAARLALSILTAVIFIFAGLNFAYNPIGSRGGNTFFDAQAALIAVVVCLGLLLIVARSATSITSERDRQCWDSLLLTSLTPREIIWAKILGGIYSARLLALMVLPLFLAGALVRPTFLLVVPFEILTVGIVALAAAALGVSCSLHLKDSLRAMAAALFVAVFIGCGVYIYCCMSCLFSLFVGKSGELLAGAAVPFLIYYPMGFYSHAEFGSLQTQGLALGYGIGLAGYAIVSLVLIASCVGELNRTPVRGPGRHIPERSPPT